MVIGQLLKYPAIIHALIPPSCWDRHNGSTFPAVWVHLKMTGAKLRYANRLHKCKVRYQRSNAWAGVFCLNDQDELRSCLIGIQLWTMTLIAGISFHKRYWLAITCTLQLETGGLHWRRCPWAWEEGCRWLQCKWDKLLLLHDRNASTCGTCNSIRHCKRFLITGIPHKQHRWSWLCCSILYTMVCKTGI